MTPLLWGIAAFMGLQFAIGAWIARRIATEDDYLVAGRRMGPLLVTGSIFATWFGAETIVGASGTAYAEGVSLASAEPFGYGLCIILMGLVFAAPLWRRRLTTLADLYRQRYSPLVERVAAVVLIPGSLLWAAAQIRAFGQVLVVSGSGVELEVALAIAAGFVILYTAVGGLLADAVTDILQAALLVIGLLVLLFAVSGATDGLGTALSTPGTAERVSLLPPGDVSVIETVEAWAIPVFGSLVATELVSRVIGARSASVARNGALAAGSAYIIVGAIAVTIGLAAGDLVGTIDDPEQILGAAARMLLSPWMYVVFAGGFLAAILSTVDSTLLVSAGLFSHNLMLPVLRVDNERVKVRVSRATVGVFGLIAYVIANTAEGISAIVEMASAFGSAGILVTVTFGLFTRFGGPRAAVVTLATGIVSFVVASLAETSTPFLISLACSLAAYILVAMTERRA